MGNSLELLDNARSLIIMVGIKQNQENVTALEKM